MFVPAYRLSIPVEIGARVRKRLEAESDLCLSYFVSFKTGIPVDVLQAMPPEMFAGYIQFIQMANEKEWKL